MTLASGSLSVLGAQAQPGLSFTVPVGRSVIIEGEGDVSVTGASELEECDAESLEALRRAASELRGARRILIVGPSDSGKSTLAAYLYNSGVVNSIISTDVGQNELYCPAFEALSIPRRPYIPGSMAWDPIASCFVGDVTPRGLEGRYTLCAVRLSRQSGSFVVDTDGWVTDEGLELKASLSLALGSDAVVAVGLDEDSLEVLRADLAGPIVAVPRLAPKAKSAGERRTNRDRLLAGCIMGSSRRVLGLSSTRLIGRAQGDLRGLVVGVGYAGSEFFGVVERAAEGKSITVLTRHAGRVDYLRLGRLRLDLEAFSDLVGR